MEDRQFSSEADHDNEYSINNASDDNDQEELSSYNSKKSDSESKMTTRKRKAPMYRDDGDYSGPDSPYHGALSSSDVEDFKNKKKNNGSSQSKSKKNKKNANNNVNNKNSKKKRKYHKRAKTAADEVDDNDDVDEEDANDDEVEEEVPDDFGDTTSSSKSNSESSSDDEQTPLSSQPEAESSKHKEIPLIQEIIGIKEGNEPNVTEDEEDEFQNDPNTLYYVKWTSLSYIHCSYLKNEQIMNISGGQSALKKYQTKINRGFRSLSQSLSIPNLMTLDDTAVSANYFEVDRVIGKRIYHFDQDHNPINNINLQEDENGIPIQFKDLEDFTNVPDRKSVV